MSETNRAEPSPYEHRRQRAVVDESSEVRLADELLHGGDLDSVVQAVGPSGRPKSDFGGLFRAWKRKNSRVLSIQGAK
jgi:hypothetical protein